MTTQRSGAIGQANDDDDDLTARAIADMAAGTERTSGMVLVGLLAVCIGLPLLLGFARGHPLLGIANALLLGLVGWGAALLVHAMVLNPVRVVCYARAANRLDRRLRSTGEPAALHRSWSEGMPGAITVARDGRVWLADRSTGYRPIILERAEIRHAEAVSHYSLHQLRGPGTAIGIGLPVGGGLIATIVRAPRPKAPKVRASHALVMHYVAHDDAAIRSTIIPFGPDLGGAKLMAAIFDYKPE